MEQKKKHWSYSKYYLNTSPTSFQSWFGIFPKNTIMMLVFFLCVSYDSLIFCLIRSRLGPIRSRTKAHVRRFHSRPLCKAPLLFPGPVVYSPARWPIPRLRWDRPAAAHQNPNNKFPKKQSWSLSNCICFFNHDCSKVAGEKSTLTLLIMQHNNFCDKITILWSAQKKRKASKGFLFFCTFFLLPFPQHRLLAVDADGQPNEVPIHGIVFFSSGETSRVPRKR